MLSRHCLFALSIQRSFGNLLYRSAEAKVASRIWRSKWLGGELSFWFSLKVSYGVFKNYKFTLLSLKFPPRSFTDCSCLVQLRHMQASTQSPDLTVKEQLLCWKIVNKLK
jgi:hypothetical protein